MQSESTDANRKTALITGGSSGIGLAIAHDLAGRGYDLLLVSNQEDALNDCRALIESTYAVACNVLFTDLAKESAPTHVVTFTRQHGLEIEILVNCAGILIVCETTEAPAEKINALLQLHVNTPTMLCRFFGNEMKRRKSGYILNVASISAVMPYPGISLYGPSKAYMRYFTRALRSEMKIYDVHVTCLIPGATSTSFYRTDNINTKALKRFGIMHNPDFVAGKASSALFRNRAECIPGIMNKIIFRLIKLIPMWLITRMYQNTKLVK